MKKIALSIAMLGLIFIHVVAQKTNVGLKFTKLWETKPGLSVPESVLYDAATGLVYVANINGKSSEKDGNGFISLLTQNGEIVKADWATGLDAPKGMGIWKKHLFVTNIDEVVEIDLVIGKILNRYRAVNSVFLNDLAIDNQGNIYITDSQASELFLLKNGKISLWKSGDEFKGANGLYYKSNTIYVGTKNAILKIDLANGKVEKALDNTGSVDGLYLTSDGKFIFSDWSGHVYMAAPDKIPELLLDTTAEKVNAADFGVIPGKNVILIPTFFDNRVMAYSCPVIK